MESIARADGFNIVQDVQAYRKAGVEPKASSKIGNSAPDLGIIVPISAYVNAPNVPKTPHPSQIWKRNWK